MHNKFSISICIPNYERLSQLLELIRSISLASEKLNGDYEIIVSDNFSPNQDQIKKEIYNLNNKINIPIVLYLNSENLGYDANLRNLIGKAKKKYIVLFGNDDLMPSNFFVDVNYLLNKFNNPKAIIRSYATFKKNINNIESKFIYTPNDILLEPCPKSLEFIFKRTVVISGLVIEKNLAQKFTENKYDGLLLFQVYLISKIALLGNICITNKILSYYRLDGVPQFGKSKLEKNHDYAARPMKSSLSFIKGLLRIAKDVSPNIYTYKRILCDISKYSYPILTIQNNLKFRKRIEYCRLLSEMGLSCTIYFYLYALIYVLNLTSLFDFFIQRLKKLLGYTPKLL